MTQHLPPALARARLIGAGHQLAHLTNLIVVAYRELAKNQSGIPSGGDGAHGKGDHADPTGAMATGRPDPARAAFDELDRLVRRIAADISDALRIARQWQPPRGQWRDALATEAAQALADDPWCESCLRVGSMSPTRTPGSRLCRWCEDTLRALGRRGQIPTWLVERHAQGRRITEDDLTRARSQMRKGA